MDANVASGDSVPIDRIALRSVQYARVAVETVRAVEDNSAANCATSSICAACDRVILDDVSGPVLKHDALSVIVYVVAGNRTARNVQPHRGKVRSAPKDLVSGNHEPRVLSGNVPVQRVVNVDCVAVIVR